MNDDDVMMILTSLPDADLAREIAEVLVGERLASCVTVLGAAHSTYRWQGEVASAEERPLMIKTTAARWPALRERLRALHPYEVPEMLALRASDGWPPYLDWVRAETAVRA